MVLQFLLFFAFVYFPESPDSILAHEKVENIQIETSGSVGNFQNGKCKKTFGNETVITAKKIDWCSNIVSDDNENPVNPYIQYSIKGKSFRINKYSIRNGCCFSDCCYYDTESSISGGCCMIYSYSLSGSNDKTKWTTLHKVEKDNDFNWCLVKTFDIPNNKQTFKYLRFTMEEPYPNHIKCMQINQMEFYGEAIGSSDNDYEDSADNENEDESISIIGRVEKRH